MTTTIDTRTTRVSDSMFYFFGEHQRQMMFVSLVEQLNSINVALTLLKRGVRVHFRICNRLIVLDFAARH